MATSETIKYTFASSDGKSIILAYNPDGNTLVELKIQLQGNFYSWCSVQDFQDFVNNVVSCVNIVNSPSVGSNKLLITPANSSIAENAIYTFIASGGTDAGYTFSIVAGTGSITSEGAFTAPAIPETDVIKVMDSGGNIAYAIIDVSSTGVEYIPALSGSPGSDQIVD